MVKEVRIYFEGDDALRPGFRAFFDNAGMRGSRLRLINTNATPVEDFKLAVASHPNAWNVLLLDAEGPVETPLADLCAQRGLAGHTDGVFWMVQMMESWFLADREFLKKFYGREFQESALSGDPKHVESIPSKDIKPMLRAATRNSRKGKYHETAHSPALLAGVDPALVKMASSNCRRLFNALLSKLNED